MKIHKRKNVMGDRRQIVNNAGVGRPQIHVEVRDRRLPPPYAERAQDDKNCLTFSWLNEEDGLFYEWLTNEQNARKAAGMGIPIFFGTLSKDRKPKGKQVTATPATPTSTNNQKVAKR